MQSTVHGQKVSSIQIHLVNQPTKSGTRVVCAPQDLTPQFLPLRYLAKKEKQECLRLQSPPQSHVRMAELGSLCVVMMETIKFISSSTVNSIYLIIKSDNEPPGSETPSHVLFHCRLHELERSDLREDMNWDAGSVHGWLDVMDNPSALASFVHKIKLKWIVQGRSWF